MDNGIVEPTLQAATPLAGYPTEGNGGNSGLVPGGLKKHGRDKVEVGTRKELHQPPLSPGRA